MISASFSFFNPYTAAVQAASENVAAGAKVYGEAVAKVCDAYGLKDQASYARYSFPHLASVTANEALGWGGYLALSGGNPFLASWFKAVEYTGRGIALGVIANPLPFA